MDLGPETLQIYQATVRVLSDRPQHPGDVLFFHNRSYGDDTGLLEIVRQMKRRREVAFIAVPNNEGEKWGSTVPFEANPGKTEYIRRLLAIGVAPSEIVVPTQMAFNTREENTVFIELARQQRWFSGAILAQPHQLLRTMLGAVQAMNQSGHTMELYTIAPNSTPWQEIVRGSQGAEEKPREQHIKDEFDRILYRQSTGELATFEELFAYWRVRGSLRLKGSLPPELQGRLQI